MLRTTPSKALGKIRQLEGDLWQTLLQHLHDLKVVTQDDLDAVILPPAHYDSPLKTDGTPGENLLHLIHRWGALFAAQAIISREGK